VAENAKRWGTDYGYFSKLSQSSYPRIALLYGDEIIGNDVYVKPKTKERNFYERQMDLDKR
jgi:hypothetical protein